MLRFGVLRFGLALLASLMLRTWRRKPPGPKTQRRRSKDPACDASLARCFPCRVIRLRFHCPAEISKRREDTVRLAIGGRIVVADDAPQGKAYCRMPAKKGSILRTPETMPGQSGRPYFLSFWLKARPIIGPPSISAPTNRCGVSGGSIRAFPRRATSGEGLDTTSGCRPSARRSASRFSPTRTAPEGQFIGVGDVQLRTASESETSAAYEAERSLLPAYDVTPRSDDGKNLALSIAKWEGRAGIAGRPFVIWAIGSSWTNSQGDGYPLIRIIRERFPSAPAIVYKKHAGSGTPWDYARGWVRQFVMAEQPDLVFSYTNGSPEGLDAMLTEIRRHTTADILSPACISSSAPR